MLSQLRLRGMRRKQRVGSDTRPGKSRCHFLSHNSSSLGIFCRLGSGEAGEGLTDCGVEPLILNRA